MQIKTKSNLRGLRDIRTRSGRVDSSAVPYMAYMKIGCLEMEKARREKEKFSAQGRIKNIDARLSEIESEKGELLTCLGERSSSQPLRATNAPTEADQVDAKGKKQGFKIRY